MGLLEKIERRLDPGERLQFALEGRLALDWVAFAAVLFPPLLFGFLARRRFVGITDRRIVVFGGWARRFGPPIGPTKLLFSLPRTTRLEHGDGRTSRVKIGREAVVLYRHTYPLLDKANAMVTAP
jgi:hypothetical protein